MGAGCGREAFDSAPVSLYNEKKTTLCQPLGAPHTGREEKRMKYELLIKTTNDGEKTVILDTQRAYPLSFEACEMDFSVEKTQEYGLPEFQISFIPRQEIRLHSMTVRLHFSENEIGGADPVYIYDNGQITNTFAGIRKLEAGAEKQVHSRELVTAHSEKGDLNAAFTTFERFYTEFVTDCEGISAVIYLEDKPVLAGERYALETLALDENLSGLDFFETYTQLLHDKHHVGAMKPIPAGWSSWSCVYGAVDEEIVLKEARELAAGWLDKGADLMQIDDGWQKEGSFGAYWTHNEKFSHDMPWLNEKIRELGLRFGIWMGPGMVVDTSSRFDELYPYINLVDGKLVKNFGGDETLMADKNGSVYGLDIGKEEVIELAREMFRRGVQEYGAEYFKVDFIVNLLVRAGNGFSRVEYEDGYAVELYKRYMREIRKTVGDDVFLLACGAPVGESVGIYDSIRISHDITWGGVGQPHHPGTWNILRNDAQCAFLRSPFHGKVFINDSDGLLVRDFMTEYCDDGLAMTLEEAKMWATVVAMCGGQILINEQIERLPQERKDIFTNILPPLGLAARPRNFYEYPWCSETYIAAEEDAQLVAIYNWGEEVLEKEVKNPFDSRAILVDCWSHQVIGYMEESMTFTLPAHTSRAFLVRKLPEKGGFLYNDGNFYLGLGARNGEDHFYEPEG